MLGKLSGWDDTIVALATPQGIGAIGVIRVSGKMAIDIVNELFLSKDLSVQPSHTLHVGYLSYNGAVLDEVVISLFKSPRSYTGENVVEISCHGSPFVQEQVLQALLNNGARSAKPGEFTLRAFLNGKLDLAQAEAVADLIASNTEISRKAALQNIRGWRWRRRFFLFLLQVSKRHILNKNGGLFLAAASTRYHAAQNN